MNQRQQIVEIKEKVFGQNVTRGNSTNYGNQSVYNSASMMRDFSPKNQLKDDQLLPIIEGDLFVGENGAKNMQSNTQVRDSNQYTDSPSATQNYLNDAMTNQTNGESSQR